MIVAAVTSDEASFGIKSFKTISARPRSTPWRFKLAKAVTRMSAPSSSRIFVEIFEAIYSRTSSGAFNLSCAAFLRRIAIRVSNSGGWMSVINPHSNRERRRSSRVVNCFWWTVARNNNLFISVIQSVKCMEELFLGALFVF